MHTRELLLIVFALLSLHAFSLPLDQFFPFGPLEGDASMFRTDDGGLELPLNAMFPFFDTYYESAFISNNGLITFGTSISDYTGDPFPLANGVRMIAGYWSDIVTTSDPQQLSAVFYRETTNQTVLTRASNLINEKFPVRPPFAATQSIVVTYSNVGLFAASYSSRSTFQIVLVSDGQRSFTFLLYHTLGWGGAQAGFNSGNSFNYYSLRGSLTAEAQKFTNESNIDIPGFFAFRVDSSTIQPGGCGSNFSLEFSPNSGNEIGGIPIFFFGPCFSNQSSILAKFGSEVTSCVWRSQVEVQCPLPLFTGRSFLPVNVWLSANNGTTWQLARGRFSYSRFDSTLVLPQLRTNSSGYLADDPFIEFEWDPMDGDIEEPILEVWTMKRSGSQEKKRVVPLVAGWALRLATRRILMRGITLSSRGKSFRDRVENILNLADWLNKEGESIFFLLRLGHRYITSEMHLNNRFNDAGRLCDTFVELDAEDGETWRRSLPECPLNLASSPPAGWRLHTTCARKGLIPRGIRFFSKLFTRDISCPTNPGAIECWTTRVATAEGAHQQCCYNENGNLITSGPGAGTPTRGSSLTSTAIYDVLPALFCGCYTGNADNCAKYQTRRRPSIGSSDSSRWRPSTTFGDPHFVTLDGAPFSFNGVGEFVLLKSVDEIEDASRFAIQIRTRAVRFGSYRASVINAVAVSAANGSKIGVYLNDRGLMDLIVDDVQIQYNPVDWISAGDDSIELTIANSSANIRLDLSNSVAIDITSFGSSLGVVASLPLIYRGRTEGLLGNWNGNASDDFVAKDGEKIDIDASPSTIHYAFGLTWSVTSRDTLFYYPLGTSPLTFSNPNYTPTFTSPIFANATFEEAARRICAKSSIVDQCLFDAAVTNNLEVARETVQSFSGYETLLTQSNLGPQFRNTVAVLTGAQGSTTTHNFDVIDFEGDSYALQILQTPSGSSISEQGVFTWNVPVDWPTGVSTVSIVGTDEHGAAGGVSFNVEIMPAAVSSANVLNFSLFLLFICVLVL